LAGFAVGAVEKSEIVTGQSIVAGDVVIGLASSGVHSNGYSLVRKIISRSAPPAMLDGQPFRERVMAPTRIYVKPVLELIKQVKVKGMAHITGGGLVENIPRCLPEGVSAVLDAKAWPQPEIFSWLQREGGVAAHEMHRTFNCGIGFVMVVAAQEAVHSIELLKAAGEAAYAIGTIEKRTGDLAATVVR
jgi:phosphoribosylformylglycinamidine cyclo-ligase